MGPSTSLFIKGLCSRTAHILPAILAHQGMTAQKAWNEAMRFVAVVRNPETDWKRVLRSPAYSQIFTSRDEINYREEGRILTLNGIKIIFQTEQEALASNAYAGTFGIFVNYTTDNTSKGTGYVLDQYSNTIKIAWKPQALKDKTVSDRFRGDIDPKNYPHIIPGINDDALVLSNGGIWLFSQASCTTGGASVMLWPLVTGIKGFAILEGSSLVTFHGATTSDEGPQVANGPKFGETGAASALQVVWGDKLPGIENLKAEAARGNWEVPSFIRATLVVKSDEPITYAQVVKLYEDAASSERFRMMLGVYHQPKAEKELELANFKGEGRTGVIVIDAAKKSFNVSESVPVRNEAGEITHYQTVITVGRHIYDNIWGYVSNNVDFVRLLLEKANALPDRLPILDKVRLACVDPQFHFDVVT